MTRHNQGAGKKKITYKASLQGVERAEAAFKRYGFESKSNFAKSQLISRSTVTKFFQRQPIQLDSFKTHIPHPNCHKRVFTEHFLYKENKNIL